MYYQLQSPGRRRQVCTENVARALLVSADGEVSPCVFTNLPVTGVTLVADGVERPYRRLTFGNVRDRSLPSIWGQIAYRNFRRSFYEERPASVCQSCAKR
ncbi:MAG: hypothetical protein FJ121_02240 [Deltaproteobacteria bacterium]|nr:hypothetical protein [Deltaproteobacteria bacterium]